MARPRKDDSVLTEDTDQSDNRRQLPAAELVRYMKASGRPEDTVEQAEGWLEQQRREHRDVTAEDLFLFLEPTARHGTVREMGAWMYGEGFVPGPKPEMSPDGTRADNPGVDRGPGVVRYINPEELVNLRSQIRRLREEVAALRAEKLGLTNQNAHLRDRVNDLQGKIGFLRVGKSKDDLEAAGLTTAVDLNA